MTVCLGLICVLLLVFITLYITITAERDLFNHTIISLQDKNTDLMTEKDQLKNNFSSLNQEKLELETRVTSLSEELKNKTTKQVSSFLCCLCMKTCVVSVCFSISNEKKSWSDSRQFCRDRGADLIIINTEEKQRFISSFVKERVWIGLSDTENEGNMKWVDNSPLNQGFWVKGEPNDDFGKEDCIELMHAHPVLNNWNDLPCSEKRKGICET
ncbi:hypothetical protein PO909_015898 [Leuciscus waleckii]